MSNPDKLTDSEILTLLQRTRKEYDTAVKTLVKEMKENPARSMAACAAYKHVQQCRVRLQATRDTWGV